MLMASTTGRSALWKFAKAVHDIITKETFTDDFETQTEFAKFVDLSKSTITMYVKAVDFVNKKEVQEFFQSDIDKLSVGKSYMLSTLDDDNLKDFFDFVTAEDVRIIEMSDKALKDMLRDLYTEKSQEEKTVESTQEETTDTAETSVDNEAVEEEEIAEPQVFAVLDGMNIVITVKGRTFTKERVIALDDEIVQSIIADFGIERK